MTQHRTETIADIDRSAAAWRKRLEELRPELDAAKAEAERIDAERAGLLVAAIGAGDTEATAKLADLDDKHTAAMRRTRDLERTREQIAAELRRLDERRHRLQQAEARRQNSAADEERRKLAATIDAAFDSLAAAMAPYIATIAEQERRAAAAGLPEAGRYGDIIRFRSMLGFHAMRALPPAWQQYSRREPTFSDVEQARERGTSRHRRAATPADNVLLDYSPAKAADEDEDAEDAAVMAAVERLGEDAA